MRRACAELTDNSGTHEVRQRFAAVRQSPLEAGIGFVVQPNGYCGHCGNPGFVYYIARQIETVNEFSVASAKDRNVVAPDLGHAVRRHLTYVLRWEGT